METRQRGMVKYYKESRVLRSAKDLPEEEWPSFVLEDAAVYKEDGKTLVNALEVTLNGPFIVRGKLVIDTWEAERRLIKPGIRSIFIEIRNVERYSVGFGPTSVWIVAEAGWVDIRPSAQYRSIYDKMFEGITLYYKVMDAYEELAGRKKAKNRRAAMAHANLDEVFYYYALGAGDGVLRNEVESRCDDHAAFLLDHFPVALHDETPFDWTTTSFYSWMHQRHRGVKKQLDEAANKRLAKLAAPSRAVGEGADEGGEVPKQQVKRGRPPREKRDNKDIFMSDAPDTFSEPFETKRRHDRSVSAGPSPGPRISEPILARPASLVTGDTSREAIVSRLVDLINTIADEKGGPRKIRYTSCVTWMYYKCKIRHYNSTKEMLQVFAADLLSSLDPEKWSGTSLWEWLEAESRLPGASLQSITMEEIPKRLERRDTSAPGRRKDPSTGEGTPVPTGRPTHSGKVPGLRLAATASRKRPAQDLDDDGTDAFGSGSSRPHHKYPNPQPNLGDDNDDDGEEEEEDEDEEGPEQRGGSNKADVRRAVFPVYKMQTDKPKGPRGTWICEECGHIIRSAEEPAQRSLVHEHLRQHQDEAIMLAQARDEGERNGVSIQNLLGKIMKASEDKKKKDKKLSVAGEKALPIQVRKANIGW